MFGISSGELFFIAIIALIVLGPERLPKATRFAGLWVRRARAQWYSVKDELEREMAADELKRSLREARKRPAISRRPCARPAPTRSANSTTCATACDPLMKPTR